MTKKPAIDYATADYNTLYNYLLKPEHNPSTMSFLTRTPGAAAAEANRVLAERSASNTISQANSKLQDYINGASVGGTDTLKTTAASTALPADMKQFLGQSQPQYVAPSNATLQQFLNTPAPTMNTAQVDALKANLQAHLNTQAPVMQAVSYVAPTTNKFDTGLSNAETKLNALLNDPSSIQQSAAYKFRLGQGQEALQRQMAAKGMLGSGNRLMELTKYGQDMASQEYEAQESRLRDLLGSYQTAWNQAQGTNVQEALGRYGTASQAALGQYGTAMQGYNARGSLLAGAAEAAAQNALGKYSTDVQARTAQGNTLANMYGTDAQTALGRYGAEMQAHTARGNTLADLYRIGTQERTAMGNLLATQAGTAANQFSSLMRNSPQNDFTTRTSTEIFPTRTSPFSPF